MLLIVAIDIVVRANIVADVDICQLASWAPHMIQAVNVLLALLLLLAWRFLVLLLILM